MCHFLSHLILIAEDQLLRPTTITLNTLLQATEGHEEVMLQLQKYGTLWKKHVPSRKLTYPTWGKGKSSSNMSLSGGYVNSLGYFCRPILNFCGSFRFERRSILQNIDLSYAEKDFSGKSLLHAKKEATISDIPKLKFFVCLDSC